MNKTKGKEANKQTLGVIREPLDEELIIRNKENSPRFKTTSSHSFGSQLPGAISLEKPSVWLTGRLHKKNDQEVSPKSLQKKDTMSLSASSDSSFHMANEVNLADMDDKWPALGSSPKSKRKQSKNAAPAPTPEFPSVTTTTSPQAAKTWSMVAQSRNPPDRASQSSSTPSIAPQPSSSLAGRISSLSLPPPAQLDSAQSTTKIPDPSHSPTQSIPTLLKNSNSISPTSTLTPPNHHAGSLKPSPALTSDSFVTNPFDPDYVQAQKARMESLGRGNEEREGDSLFTGFATKKRLQPPQTVKNEAEDELVSDRIRGHHIDVSSNAAKDEANPSPEYHSQTRLSPPSLSTKTYASLNDASRNNDKRVPFGSWVPPIQADQRHRISPGEPTPNARPSELLPTPILVQFNYGIQFAYATHSAVASLFIPPYPPSSHLSTAYHPVTCHHLIHAITSKANYPHLNGRTCSKLRSVHIIWQTKADTLNWVAPTTIIDTLPRSVARRVGSFSMDTVNAGGGEGGNYYFNGGVKEYPVDGDGMRQWGSGLTYRRGGSKNVDSDYSSNPVLNNHATTAFPSFSSTHQPSANSNTTSNPQPEPFIPYSGATTSPSKWSGRGFEKSNFPTGKWADLTTVCDEELWIALKLMAVRGWKANLVAQFEVEGNPHW